MNASTLIEIFRMTFQKLRDNTRPTHCPCDFLSTILYSHILVYMIILSRWKFFVHEFDTRKKISWRKRNWLFCIFLYSIVKVLDHWQMGLSKPGISIPYLCWLFQINSIRPPSSCLISEKYKAFLGTKHISRYIIYLVRLSTKYITVDN